MVITVCVGSSCHYKGSQLVVEKLQKLIGSSGIADKVVLKGSFCLGECQAGVNVMLDGERYSVTPATTEDFFEKRIASMLREDSICKTILD